MVDVIPPDHMDDVPVVEPNQHDDVPIVPEPVLVDEDEDLEEEKFKEEEDPQEEEDDMEVNIKEDENEPDLTYPYEELDPLNPPPPAFESEPEDVNEVENLIESEDETVPASVYEVGESSTAPFLHEENNGILPYLMRRDINSLFGRMASLSRRLYGRDTAHALVKKKGKAKDKYYGKLILDLGNEVRSSVDQGMATMEKLVEKLGNTEDKVKCKKLKKELEEASLDKAYDRFQKLISQLEVHGARISKEDINQKFLRSLPSSWNQIALIMRNKPDIDEIDIDDLYNNLRVYEDELKRSSGSNSASQNLVFLSSENTSSTNEVSTASGDFGVSTAGGINQIPSTPCAHDVAYSFFAQPTNSPQLENEDFQQMDGDDLEELDLQCNDFEVEPVNYALMAISSSSSSSSSDSEKVVKERDELKDKIAKWEESTKNLDEILNSQMSARDKTGLGYGTQLNELSSNHETDSENSLSIFDVRSSDEENTLENDRFSKNRYTAIPTPITGNFLTPRADISFAGLDEYAIRNKIIESQTTELNTKTSETAGQTNDENIEKPKSASESVVSNSKIDRDRVIIEDWNSDDEEEVSEVQRVRPETQIVKTRDDKSGQNSKKQGMGFRKVKDCFVCKSTYHLIKDCNFHDKKSQEPKLKMWLILIKGRANQPSVSIARLVYATRPIYLRMDNVRPRGSCSPIKRSYYTKPAFRPKDLKQDVTIRIRAVVNTDSRSFMLKKGNPEILLQDHAVVDSG
ncbi:hypothetical protein Tco_1291835, partial [Tanacetum coccineum]